MPNIFEVTDPHGRKIVCTEDTWNGHILGQRPWMVGWEDEVREAIRNPTAGIYQHPDHPNRNLYYAFRTGRRDNKGRYLKVVVAFDEPKNGIVITAYPTTSGKAGETLI